LWNRAADEEITEPQWTPSVTKPFAYTTGSTMTVNVLMTSEDVTDAVDIRYTVGGTWRNSLGEIKGTPYSVDKDTGHGSFPYSLAHQTTALDSVMDYRLDQSYDFYVRKSSADEWCYADEGNATHPQVYLTFGQLIGPWGPSANPRGCWSRVVKNACEWMPETGYTAQYEREAMKRLAYKAYMSSGVTYDGNRSHYVLLPDETNPTSRRFNCWHFITDLDQYADCQDMSLWWEMLCHSLGTSAYAQRIDGPFTTKPILPVGGSSWGSYPWNFHHIGWDNAVFDPCVEVNQSSPRVPQDEGINNPYKTDIYNSGTWNPLGGFALGGTDPFLNLPTEVN
ncbi:MAG TPA: hypothetical protein VFI02_08755, partial [Armatimonadota bacterium]|nr:hypothetical protein [Armatimonadota bacterium]